MAVTKIKMKARGVYGSNSGQYIARIIGRVVGADIFARKKVGWHDSTCLTFAEIHDPGLYEVYDPAAEAKEYYRYYVIVDVGSSGPDLRCIRSNRDDAVIIACALSAGQKIGDLIAPHVDDEAIATDRDRDHVISLLSDLSSDDELRPRLAAELERLTARRNELLAAGRSEKATYDIVLPPDLESRIKRYIEIQPDDTFASCDFWESLHGVSVQLENALIVKKQAVVATDLWQTISKLPGFEGGGRGRWDTAVYNLGYCGTETDGHEVIDDL